MCASKEPSEPSDFVPLSVQYQERFSAAGRTRSVGDALDLSKFLRWIAIIAGLQG